MINREDIIVDIRQAVGIINLVGEDWQTNVADVLRDMPYDKWIRLDKAKETLSKITYDWMLDTANKLWKERYNDIPSRIKRDYPDDDKILKFFEFNSVDFGYYALIGAKTMEKAIEYYNDELCDIEDDNKPNILSYTEAKSRAISKCLYDINREDLSREFDNLFKNEEDVWLVLVDSDLL